ncbi:hypothetical protein M3181_18530 [Mesobacillus maritimus]|uniref:hypothetical protein n=1 Tax=Mesobacillus maritimus TaxID=1643336 RepID=UPI00203D7A0C|nr:hypothetical protein [Mesobacillus maritimus]MCM3670961.1 hypothetical protein [Mesobacillus maritimus]
MEELKNTETMELVFEQLEQVEAPVDPWVAGFAVGGSFVTGLAIGAGIAVLT